VLVVVVTASVVDVVVDLAAVTLLEGGLVGMKAGVASATLVLRLSSMRSVSTKPLKFCFDLSFCRFIRVMSWSAKTCSVGTLSSEATSEKGIMLLSSEFSIKGELPPPERWGLVSLSNLEGMSKSRWSALVACTWAIRMLGSKNESGLDEDVGLTVVSNPPRVGTVGTVMSSSVVTKTSSVVDVDSGLSLRLGMGDLLPESGRSLRRGKPLGLISVSARGMRLIGRPELDEARGISGRSFSTSSSCSSLLPVPPIGRLARLPVGMIRTPDPGRPLDLFPVRLDPLVPVVSLAPVGGALVPVVPRALVDTLSTGSFTGPLMAAVGPGKSSGTMGRPLTLDNLDGGVGNLAGGSVGGGVVVLSAGSTPKSV
jgi:hypothetical protein